MQPGKHVKLLCALLFLFILLPAAHADMGRITTTDVNVREDSQKAIILHNLDYEVLILGTDLVSDRKTKILRFIPFPSEPKVSLAEKDAFEQALKLIKRHKLAFMYHTKGGAPSATPVEMRFNARLGVHDVTVVKINEILEFGSWVREFLDGKGLPLGKDYREVEEVASDYVKRGFRYFVFDLVDVTPELHFVEPIAYRFKSKRLYYPLKTSNTFGGSGGIDLLIIAPGTLCDPFGEALYITQKELYSLYPCMRALSKNGPYHVRISTSAEISRVETESVYAPAGKFFHENGSVFMQLISYNGEYDFDDDILIDISKLPREAFDGGESLSIPGDTALRDLLKSMESPPSETKDKKDDTRLMLEKTCIKATMAAIEMEIKRFEQKLKAAKSGPGDPGNVPFFEKRIEKLRAEHERYEKMRPLDYLMPKKKTVKGKVSDRYAQGSLLEINDMSRSGPFYHVAGIGRNNYHSLKPGRKYRMTIYLVYPRDYPFPSYYVYIQDFQ